MLTKRQLLEKLDDLPDDAVVYVIEHKPSVGFDNAGTEILDATVEEGDASYPDNVGVGYIAVRGLEPPEPEAALAFLLVDAHKHEAATKAQLYRRVESLAETEVVSTVMAEAAELIASMDLPDGADWAAVREGE